MFCTPADDDEENILVRYNSMSNVNVRSHFEDKVTLATAASLPADKP